MARPLLPYEKELIRVLGCTEEEYRRYASEVALRGRARPAGYELIPDVQNGPVVGVIVSLVVGAALTAVGALLAPKPQAQAAQPQQNSNSARGKSVRLASRQGSERFGPTSGFDSINDLANYAEPIAVVFAKREDEIGGVLASTQLVWSRAFSYGNEQGVKLLFVLGEQGLGEGVDRPDLEGIYLGTTPLDAIYSSKFCFYWNRNTNVNGRILAKNHAYGTRAQAWAGDPQINDDIFLGPSRSATNDYVFSQSYTPSSNTQFGCYAGIANGTGYRVNFELVPMPVREGTSDEQASAQVRKRQKVSGTFGATSYAALRRNGQRGVGREYGRHMGIFLVNGVQVASGAADQHKVAVSVNVGDTCTFLIKGGFIPEDGYWDQPDQNDVNVDDINNATIRMREEADDTLQVGQTIMIGRTVWVVKSRAIPVWGAGVVGPFEQRGDQSITMECIEVFATSAPGNQIGAVSDVVLNRNVWTDDQGKGQYEYETPFLKGLTVGPGFYPLMRVSLGLVRNTRPCDTTEIGLKSQVWNRANGLCNFASLPVPSGMVASDRNGDSLTSGQMTLYFNRTSVFTVFLRPAGTDENGNEYAWEPIHEQFAIRGSRPVDQYNFLRFVHPEQREYEYRFIPKNGGDLARHTLDDAEFWLLDARLADYKYQGVLLEGVYTTPYGQFRVQAAGRRVLKGEIEFAPEMATGVTSNEVQKTIQAPQTAFISEYFPDETAEEARASAVVVIDWSSVPAGSQYRQSALFYELWGQASYLGLTKTRTVRFNGLRDNRWIELQFRGTVNSTYPDNHPYFPGWRAWGLVGLTVISSSDRMNVGDTFNCRIPVSPGNPRNPSGYSQVGVEIRVSAVNTGQASSGRESGYSYELLGNADSYPVGTTRTTNIGLLDGSRSVELEYSAKVVTPSAEFQQKWGVNSTWDYEDVKPIPGTTTGNWQIGAVALHTVRVSSGNPFRDPGSEVGVYYQVSSVGEELEVIGLSSDRVFEENAQITDISNYTERSTSNENSPEHNIVYVTETVKSDPIPNYQKLTTCALALRASRDFSRIDQVRVWLDGGIEVQRFHPSELGTVGPSNLLPDLVYYLFTDTTAGLGKFFSDELIDTESFSRACTFLRTNKLFFNGAITEPQNVRSYITGVGPFFLLDFVIGNGKFSLEPAVPVTPTGAISQAAVPVSALFTEGNIIEESFAVEYLEADQRRDFTAVMRWRYEQRNKLPQEKTVTIRYNEAGSETYPLESFDLSEYCCSEEHAILAAKFILSLRRRVTHTVSFKTTPEGLNLAPGQYIKVVTQASPYQAANNGVVEADGTLVMSRPIGDNAYPIWYFNRDQDTVLESVMNVVDGKVVETELWDTLVTLRYPGISSSVYQVQELTLEEDGLVQIVASEHPTTGDGVSLIVQDLLTEGVFKRDY